MRMLRLRSKLERPLMFSGALCNLCHPWALLCKLRTGEVSLLKEDGTTKASGLDLLQGWRYHSLFAVFNVFKVKCHEPG